MGPVKRRALRVEVLGPWSLATSRAFWEGFAPAVLATQPENKRLRSVFRVEGDWRRADVEVTQVGSHAHITVSGDGDLDAAATQSCRFLSLDIDARAWPEVAGRDPVIADAQQRLPGLRPCGFHSPYEAAAWSVLSQRTRIVQAARLRDDLVARHGEDGAFPAPDQLRALDLDLPAARPSTCAPSLKPRSKGASTVRCCDPSIPTKPSASCRRSRVSARSLQNSS